MKIFRRLRKIMLKENRFRRYLVYALGEIVLVVIGILIALQINNWNEERIHEEELQGLLKSISGAIQWDVNNLKTIRMARAEMGKQVDSIFQLYPTYENNSLTGVQFYQIAQTFNNLMNSVFYQPNTSSFEALKNSIYLSELYGTDIEALLHYYYTSAAGIERTEEEYNQAVEDNFMKWLAGFSKDESELFRFPWNYPDSNDKFEQFLKVLKAERTLSLLNFGLAEGNMVDMYDKQILLGEKFIEMVNNEKMNFEGAVKSEFANLIGTYSEVEVVNVVKEGKISEGYNYIFASSGNFDYSIMSFQDGYTELAYPENTLDWAAVLFQVYILNGRVRVRDFSPYTEVLLEVKGSEGGEQFAITLKDKNDPPDGSEFRVPIQVTDAWQTYAFSLDQFKTADLSILEIPLAFVFQGNQGRTVHVRSIQFR